MFGITPEGSGMKNVLNGYFAYVASYNLRGPSIQGLSQEEMANFSVWYFNKRLRSLEEISVAGSAMREHNILTGAPLYSLTSILVGLLAAENMLTSPISVTAIEKVADKFSYIPEHILGLDALTKPPVRPKTSESTSALAPPQPKPTFHEAPETAAMREILERHLEYKPYIKSGHAFTRLDMPYFTDWYLRIRLQKGPKYDLAIETIKNHGEDRGVTHNTLVSILIGILTVENKLRSPLNLKEIEEVLKEFPEIPEPVLGLNALRPPRSTAGASHPSSSNTQPQTAAQKKLSVTCHYCLHVFKVKGALGDYQVSCPEPDCGKTMPISIT